jgi:GNAT superfamily N-acetyltransferase
MTSSAHAIARRPSPGDQVNALLRSTNGRTDAVTMHLPDGSMVLTKEELAIFGDGDAARGGREIRLMIANERERAINEGECPRSKSATVRVAKPSDEKAIFDLLLLDIAENAAMVAPPSDECILETVKQALTPPNVAGVIDGPDGTIVGVAMLIAMRWWWSRSYYYQEIPLFVHPDHRKSTHARQLMNFNEWWVDEMTRSFGYRIHLLCGVLGTVRIRAKIAMYRRRYRQVGAVYLYPWAGGRGEIK